MTSIPAKLSLFTLVIGISGCGGGSTPPPAPQPPVVAGNFQITTHSQAVPGNQTAIGGPLTTDSAGHISGILHIVDNQCFNVLDDAVFSGTISPQGQLAATANVAGQAITVQAQVSVDGKTMTGGTYSIAGGCAAGDHGTFTGSQVQPFTGTYNASFSFNASMVMSISIPVTQPSTADPHGLFEFPASTATMIFPFTQCGFNSAVMQTGSASSVASGLFFKVTMAADDGVSTLTFTGLATDDTAKKIGGTMSITGQTFCGKAVTGFLTRP